MLSKPYQRGTELYVCENHSNVLGILGSIRNRGRDWGAATSTVPESAMAETADGILS